MGGPFSSMVAIWEGERRERRGVTASGCRPRPLLQPTLSTAVVEERSAGGQEERRGGNQWSCWRASSRAARSSHSHNRTFSSSLHLRQPPSIPPFSIQLTMCHCTIPFFLSRFLTVFLYYSVASFHGDGAFIVVNKLESRDPQRSLMRFYGVPIRC